MPSEFFGTNIFGRKRNDENFPHDLFGIEINKNKNKANYGITLKDKKPTYENTQQLRGSF